MGKIKSHQPLSYLCVLLLFHSLCCFDLLLHCKLSANTLGHHDDNADEKKLGHHVDPDLGNPGFSIWFSALKGTFGGQGHN